MATFAITIEDLQNESRGAFQYLEKIDKSLWTRAFAKYLKYGYDISNIIESLNNSGLDIRHLPPLQLIDSIYSIIVRMVYHRF
jgi:hypothetical protein